MTPSTTPRPARHVLDMTWHDLLFAHWRVPLAALRPLIPAPLALDAFDGSAWLGVVPFRMTGVRFRFLPPIPTTSAFVELNVRTYVTHGSHAGVWFFSLDATSRLAVRFARSVAHLNYHDARMSCERSGDAVEYRSTRIHRGASIATFDATFGPTGPPFEAREGSLEHFLTERYCLFCAARDGRVWRADIEHPPWPLRPAAADFRENSMSAPLHIPLEGSPHLLFADRLEVKAWPRVRLV